MDSRTSRIIEDLAGAISDVNDALSLTADERDERTALERLVRTLRKAVDHKPLWIELEGQATGANQMDARVSAESFLTEISTVLSDAHAKLLDRCGYRFPPPPPAFQLVERTRKAVLRGGRRPRWGREHVQQARSGLYEFVSKLEEALRTGTGLRGILLGARPGTVAVHLLIALVGAVEVKTGDAFGVELGTSLKDPIKIEITVPAPWAADGQAVAAVRAVIVNSQVSNLGETIDMAPYEPYDGDMPEDWRAAWVDRWYSYPPRADRETEGDSLEATMERARRAVQDWAARDEDERRRQNEGAWYNESADDRLDDSDGYSR